MNSVNDIIKTIDDLLHSKQVKIKEIADNTGISRNSISLLKTGNKDIRSLTFGKIEKLYNFADLVQSGGFVSEKNKPKKQQVKPYDKNKRSYQRISDKQRKKLEENGIDPKRYYIRKRSNWSLKDAVEKPVREIKRITDEERETLKRNGIKEMTFNSRISRGWDRQKALKTKARNRRV